MGRALVQVPVQSTLYPASAASALSRSLSNNRTVLQPEGYVISQILSIVIVLPLVYTTERVNYERSCDVTDDASLGTSHCKLDTLTSPHAGACKVAP